MKSVTLDTETTGLDPQQGHKVIEIGCVELHNNFPTGRTWQRYINPERNMPLEAYQIHGITEEFLSDKPTFNEIADEFLSFIEGSTLIIHNANFDLKFLNFELDKIRKSDLRNFDVVDTLILAKKLFPGMPANLDSLSRRYKLDITKRVKHGALLDAEILAEVYLEMQGGRQQGIKLKSNQKNNIVYNDLEKHEYNKHIYTLKEDELRLHEEMLKKIRGSLWKKKQY